MFKTYYNTLNRFSSIPDAAALGMIFEDCRNAMRLVDCRLDISRHEICRFEV